MSSPIAHVQADIMNFCCADGPVGGCSHIVISPEPDQGHSPVTGECQAAGCPCASPRRHPAWCVHMTDPEVPDGSA